MGSFASCMSCTLELDLNALGSAPADLASPSFATSDDSLSSDFTGRFRSSEAKQSHLFWTLYVTRVYMHASFTACLHRKRLDLRWPPRGEVPDKLKTIFLCVLQSCITDFANLSSLQS